MQSVKQALWIFIAGEKKTLLSLQKQSNLKPFVVLPRKSSQQIHRGINTDASLTNCQFNYSNTLRTHIINQSWAHMVRLVPVAGATARARGGTVRNLGCIARSGLRGGRSRR
jgi:hypothetical protein